MAVLRGYLSGTSNLGDPKRDPHQEKAVGKRNEGMILSPLFCRFGKHFAVGAEGFFLGRSARVMEDLPQEFFLVWGADLSWFVGP